MLFNSFTFIVFAAIFFSVWPFVAPRRQARWMFLTAASFVFYGWWDWRFLFLMIASGGVDYWGALMIEKNPSRAKIFLTVSLTFNLGVLAFFKYANFFLDTIRPLVHASSPGALAQLSIILPVGISFYTFHSMSYTIDVYRGRLKPTHNPFHFFAFLSMFPQLVAGPIVRAHNLLPQLEEWKKPEESKVWEGLRLIALGFFKKTVIADTLAVVVNDAFGGDVIGGTLYWWLIVSFFALQIYCDFSGYSNIALGLMKWLGYELPLNFDRPYTSTSFREFWTRWHISLSSWFRDYVYLPLGGSEKGPARNLFNLWVTFLLSGLWHGAAWTFVGWGALHAFYLTVERYTAWPARLKRVGFSFGVWLLVTVQVWVGWVLFRSQSMAQAGDILRRMFVFQKDGLVTYDAIGRWPLAVFAFCCVAGAAHALGFEDWAKKRGAAVLPYLEPVAISGLLLASLFLRGPGSDFIYFQF